MNLVSAGAAQTVTGSCHLVEIGGKRVLLDCGLFQGPSELEARNHDPFPFDPAELDAVIVSHGHLDHVGRLPLLVARGYDGPIHATRPTREIARVILEDAAKIQAEEYARALRKAERAGREQEVPPPLYGEAEVGRAVARFAPLAFGAPLELGGVRVTLQPAGHILGSAYISLESDEGRVVFSGDLGNRESALQAPAEPPGACDAVLVETTYADRDHPSREATLERFRAALERALQTGGKVLIPSFALERTQVILHELKRLEDEGVVRGVPVFLDSPMATTFTELYATCRNEFLPGVQAQLERGENPFEPSTMHYAPTPQDSKAINDLAGPAIVVAGSGMMSGGRILHHLKHHLWQRETTVLVVGYQAQGTLGRALVEGAQRVRIFGDEIVVRAEIRTLNGFSAHADQDDLLAWLSGAPGARVYMVHGEPPAMSAFERVLAGRKRDALMVAPGEPYPL